MPNDYHERNRQSWNSATQQHHSHKPDLIERYKAGYNHLHEDDMVLLGDLTGKTLVHLQCNDGQDTVSIAQHLGATVTGVDISDYAIDFARKLAAATDTAATFVRSDIFDWFEDSTTQYDVVYTSYGALVWISDVNTWARGIAKTLKPGGRFVNIDFHPLIGMFENDWSLRYDYMGGTPIASDGVGDYVGNDYEGTFQNPHRAYEFSWGIAEMVMALMDAGLTLTHLKEYDYMNGWQRFPEMRSAGRKHFLPDDKPKMALMYSIVATRPA